METPLKPSDPNPNGTTVSGSESSPEPDTDATISETLPTENHRTDDSSEPPPNPPEAVTPARKRRRRKKFFTELNGNPSVAKNRRADIAKEVNVEALIAVSVGFPVDSLTEEEIEANVVSVVGGSEQANYIVIRNHILARWRSNVSVWLTHDNALEAIRSEHRSLVDSAYRFLVEHGYVNFGLRAAMKEPKLRSFDGVERGNVVIIGAGLAGLTTTRQLLFLGFKVAVLEGHDRPGGRVKTKNMSNEGFAAAADLGGSVLTEINGNPLEVLARLLVLEFS